MRGGKRAGAGRPKGSPNKVTAQKRATLRELAEKHSKSAVQTLADICNDEEAPHAARVSAATAILDRAYGKPVQATELMGEGGGDIRIITSIAPPPNE